VRDLALEVRLVDDVGVNDPEASDSGCREVERSGGAQAAGADQQDPRVEQPQLALLADLGDQEVPAVARLSCRAERPGQLRRQAVALPVGVAAGQGDRPLVAELGEGLRRERGAVAGGAIEDDGLRAVRRGLLDPLLQIAAWHVHGAG
jgi:hypothetical protein